MGLTKCLAVVLAAAVLGAGVAAGAGGLTAGSAAYLASRQSENGGFAEQGRTPDAAAHRLGGARPRRGRGFRAGAGTGARVPPRRARPRLRRTETWRSASSRSPLSARPSTRACVARLRRHRPDVLVNETIWSVLALRAAGEQPPAALVQAILAGQAKSGGFPWSRGGKPDSNDTAAAIQALRAAGVAGAPIRRAVAALRAFQAPSSGGFSLTAGREPDAQSTAWAIQALLSAGERPGKAPFRFLARLRRADGSYRYSVRYGTTPVWVTAQVLPALAGRPFPLR